MVAAGKPAISAGQYLQLETSYRQALDGLVPTNFYDQPTDFTAWIAGEVDPNEVKARATQAFTWANNTDPFLRQQLKDYYGIDETHIAAYALDRQRALPLLQKQATVAQIGASAARNQLHVGVDRATYLADAGVTEATAAQGFGQAAEMLPIGQKLASIWGGEFDQTTAEDASLLGLASARRRVQQLSEQETAAFSGHGGASKLAQGTAGKL
jgi:hypothetical protein